MLPDKYVAQKGATIFGLAKIAKKLSKNANNVPVEAGVGIAAACEAELFINDTRLLRLEALGMDVVGAKTGDAPDTPNAPDTPG